MPRSARSDSLLCEYVAQVSEWSEQLVQVLETGQRETVTDGGRDQENAVRDARGQESTEATRQLGDQLTGRYTATVAGRGSPMGGGKNDPQQ